MRNEEDIKGLERWLHKNHFTPQAAKEFLQSIRNQKAREYSTHRHDFSGKHIKVGVLGDSHLGNKWTDIKFLESIMKYFKSQGVEAVYHTGDMTDGPWQRHRNVLEQYAHGFDAQVDDFVGHFPDIGKPVYLINGNHDLWFLKGEGANVGRTIADRRPDVHYLGDEEAIVKIANIEVMLSHPDDGNAYAYSYKAQKFVESLFKMGEKIPDIILQGHYHKLFNMAFGGTNYFCTGTTERQTPWMRGKKIAADLGAWELDIYRDSKGGLAKLTSTLLPYKK